MKNKDTGEKEEKLRRIVRDINLMICLYGIGLGMFVLASLQLIGFFRTKLEISAIAISGLVMLLLLLFSVWLTGKKLIMIQKGGN